MFWLAALALYAGGRVLDIFWALAETVPTSSYFCRLAARDPLERSSMKTATNVIDARWVLKWKVVNGKRIIQARLVVRGFKDLQAEQLNTFAGTTTR